MCEKFAIHSRRMFSNRSQLLSALKDSLKKAQFQGFRVLLVLAGDTPDPNIANSYCEDVIDLFRATVSDHDQPLANMHFVTSLSTHIMHVPDQHSNADITDQINKLLGTENSCLIFDAHGGFDPRMLAASAGTVVAGGLFVLLTPPLQDWLGSESELATLESAFLKRFAIKLIADHPKLGNERHSASDALPDNIAFLIDGNSSTYGSSSDRTRQAAGSLLWKNEQDELLETLLHHLNKPTASNVVVVQGDRGRGKSALVGRAISHYQALETSNHGRFSLCASAQPAVKVLVKHAASPIPFYSIEQALRIEHDILIVEEAGSIPIALLEKLILCAKTTVFITTVQGYEGAGRGFAIRFAKKLDSVAPSWLKLNPRQPVRWSPGDPLETFTNDAFLLDLNPTTIASPDAFTPHDALVREVHSNELLANETLLRDVYGLLTQAHYQTTPTDLRNILDKKDVLVFVQHANDTLTGAALVALEGNIPQELHKPIVQKKRRLNDQIIPQLLAQSSGDGSELSMRYARIVRIAIVPAIQNKGFGQGFYRQLNHLLKDRADCMGASFGADKASLSFWLTLGLKPIHYGYKVNPRSGLRAACLISSEQAQIAALVNNANGILHINTKAFAQYQPQHQSQHPEQNDTVIPLILAASKLASTELSDELIQNNLIAFNKGERSFTDSAGLLLAHEAAQLDSNFKYKVEQAIASFSSLSPAARREQEKLLRTTLSEYLY